MLTKTTSYLKKKSRIACLLLMAFFSSLTIIHSQTVVESGVVSGTVLSQNITDSDCSDCSGITTEFTVTFDWNGGVEWIHGISLATGGPWTNPTFTAIPGGFIPWSGCGPGGCTTGTYGDGVYYDATSSSSGCAASGANNDGNPCNNYGLSGAGPFSVSFSADIAACDISSGNSDLVINLTSDGASGGWSGAGTTGMLTITPDLSSISCDFTPVINCPADITILHSASTATSNTGSASVDANCSNPMISFSDVVIPTPPCAFESVIERTFMAVNDCGQTSSCTQTITVELDEALIPPNITNFSIDPGSCGGELTVATIGGTPGTGFVFSTSAFPGESFPFIIPGTGSIELSFTAPTGNYTASLEEVTVQGCVVDVTGIIAPVSFTIGDTEPPVIVCSGNQMLTTSGDGTSGDCIHSDFSGFYTISDNCANGGTLSIRELFTDEDGAVIKDATIDLIEGTWSPFGDWPSGVNTATITVTDGAGLTATCSYQVTVTDDEDPMITCPANIVVNNDADVCGAMVDYVVTATDNCDVPIAPVQTGGLASGSVFPVGVSTVSYSVTDAAGNSDNCSFTVTVNDTEMPNAICQDATIQLDANGDAVLVIADVNNGSTDNCGIADFSLSQETFDCTNVGTTTVQLTVTDIHGNAQVCDASVTVEDNVAPDAVCQNITIELDENGEVSIVAADVDGGSVDNCGIASISINNGDFDCSNIGENNVTMTVTDINGNSAQCTAVVTVEDNIAPVIVCTPHVSKKSNEGICGDYISLIDPIVVSENCGIASITSDAPADEYYPVGTTIVTFFVEDAGGNITTCETEVKVTDLEEPVIDCENVIQVYLQPNQCSVFVPMPAPEVTDNCDVASVFNDSPGTFTAGNTFVMWQATDIHGNVSYCETEVRVKDITAPVITSCPNDIIVDAHPNLNGGAYVDFAATATDNCGSTFIHYSQNPNTIFPVGTTTVYVDATDTQGNHDYCEFTVTVLPIFSVDCPDDIVTTVADDLNGAFVSWNEPSLMLDADCDCAEEEINGFDHVGDFGNSQYYLYNLEKVEWADALLLAELAGGHLVTIGSATENQWVSDAIAPYNLEEGAWMGLNDLETESINEWVTGEPLVYENFHAGMPDDTSLEDVYLFQNDGEWEDKPVGLPYYFIMEVTCINIEQTNDANALNGGFFPIGTTTVTYTVSDNCGNADACSFDIMVESNTTMPLVDPCQIAGAEGLHIESFRAGDFENISGNNNGYADFVGEPIQIGETTEIQLTPGGTFADGKAFWTVWMDSNNDGDFYDNELLYQAEAEGVHNATFEMPTNADLTSITHTIRIAVSNESFIAPCGDFGPGEVEDYRVAVVSEIVSNGCYLEFFNFEGSKEFAGNQLNWGTQSDCKVGKYKVQHSLDGINFEDIKKIDANNGVDVSTYYNWTHEDAYNGINYYRIAAETTEDVIYTHVIEIKSVEFGKATIFPNPANDKANIDLSAYAGKAAQLSIFNVLGQQMWTSQYDALPSAPISLDLRNYNDQTMYVTIQIEGHSLISLPLVVDRINLGGARD